MSKLFGANLRLGILSGKNGGGRSKWRTGLCLIFVINGEFIGNSLNFGIYEQTEALCHMFIQ
jgi:hypothetical protein